MRVKIGRLLTGITATVVAIIFVLWLYHSLRGRVSTLTRDSTAPYGRFVLDVRSLFSSVTDLAKGVTELKRENEALIDENDALRVKLLVLDEIQRDNDNLRKAIGLGLTPSSFIVAEVVSRGGATGWWKIARINKGVKDGVIRNSPVVSTSGLVGRVVETSAETADVLLLTDVNSKLSCYIEDVGQGARGILTGTGVSGAHSELDLLHFVEPMSLAYLEKSLEIKKGARIVTSGIGGLYPRGLPVGEVVESISDPSGLFQRAKVAPYVDFASIDRVFVLLGKGKPNFKEGMP